LRDRKSDIETIANHLLRKISKRYNKNLNKLSPEMVEVLNKQAWNGNVRELQNFIERLVIVGEEEVFKEDSINLAFNELHFDANKEEEERISLEGSLEDIERKVILKILEEEN